MGADSSCTDYGTCAAIVHAVPEGDFFGFIGPNGAGKSTTIRTLLGLISPNSGSASIFGMDIINDKKKILSQTGYLPSEAVFYPGMKVHEVLTLSANLRKISCQKQSDLEEFFLHYYEKEGSKS